MRVDNISESRLPRRVRTTNDNSTSRVRETLQRGLSHLASVQTERGSWWGDYGGPMFLLPLYVFVCDFAGQTIPQSRREGMIRYLFNAQAEDGSTGVHVEGQGCMYTTTLSYVALRVLGVSADDPRMTRTRRWIHANGTPLAAAAWGKFALALMGLYDWRGVDPVTPELWLLPYSLPFHPGRFWCHCRQVYLPMAYLYGMRATRPVDQLTVELRAELYDRAWESIDFARPNQPTAPTDNYRPVHPVLKMLMRVLRLVERIQPQSLRKRALREVFRHIEFEDSVTNDIRIGPVNAVLNTLCHHVHDPTGDAVTRSFRALENYVWEGHDGIKFQGYNSTELWDTAFAVQAILATPMWRENFAMLDRAHDFIRDNQILEDVPDHEAHYRHRSRGGWPFSNRPHGWPITDCTAEGLKCAAALEQVVKSPVPTELQEDAVRLMLSFQNDDGGFATYELKRGGAWLEALNPSQVFGDIMVDYSYTECTSAVLQSLVRVRGRFGGRQDVAINKAVARAVKFLRRAQRTDGSWEGSWGVCFTYGTWFAVNGLVAAGEGHDDPAVVRACRFLLEHQKADGSWGEHHTSCSERRYVQHRDGQVVMTSWALLTLLRAKWPDREPLDRAAKFLMDRQSQDGSWPREAIAGVFNRTCMINYDNYRLYFPVWALGEWLADQTR